MADDIVRFERVSKSYDGEALAVIGLDLAVKRGEFLTLLGPSGSGKTTTLLMLAGFEVPTEGDIYIEGRRVNELPPYKRGVGMVFQNYALFPHMTVAANIAFPLTVRGVPQAEISERVDRALAMVKLSGLGARRPRQLSGGQQQRVALARALIFEPKLVLLDEPLGALDKQLREQMQLELKHLHEELGVTMIYVTHDQSEALTMSDRVAVFNEGRIRQLADPKTLYEQPDNAFVAQFVGENNRFTGRVVSLERDLCTVDLGDGDLVQALPVDIDAPGGEASLSLRPEKVRINPAEEASFSNVHSARVEELIYLGDQTRLRLSVCGSKEFIARVSNEGEGQSWERGQVVRVAWHAHNCRAFRHGEGDAGGSAARHRGAA